MYVKSSPPQKGRGLNCRLLTLWACTLQFSYPATFNSIQTVCLRNIRINVSCCAVSLLQAQTVFWCAVQLCYQAHTIHLQLDEVVLKLKAITGLATTQLECLY